MRRVKKMFEVAVIVIVGLAGTILSSILSIWEGIKTGGIWLGAFNPLITVLFTWELLSKQIENILNAPSADFIQCVIVITESFGIIFSENAIVELAYRWWRGDEQYEIVQKAQRYSNSYALIIVSLTSLYFVVSPPPSNQENWAVFAFGVIFFLATIYNDLYYEIISAPGRIKELSKRVQEKLQEDPTK